MLHRKLSSGAALKLRLLDIDHPNGVMRASMSEDVVMQGASAPVIW
jgi:hypothetical protein